MTVASRKGWDAVVLNKLDNLATALRHLKAGETVQFKVGDEAVELTLKTDVGLCHKFTIVDVSTGDRLFKYGELIAAATEPIAAGSHAHVHNIKSLRAAPDSSD